MQILVIVADIQMAMSSRRTCTAKALVGAVLRLEDGLNLELSKLLGGGHAHADSKSCNDNLEYSHDDKDGR